MCGFSGFMEMPARSEFEMKVAAQRMAATISHRGPDDSGVWADAHAGIVLCHKRLSILDLSPAGHQPMRSASTRFMIAFNGEIYNHLSLRQMLDENSQAPCWRGHSDTETLLACFDAWGIQDTIKRSIGMFAFAVWDRQTDTLTLGRDRLGEKPLYYGWQGRGSSAVFLFGSELKALRAHSSFENRISRGALSLQLRHSYIPSPYSIYKGIAKLPPGNLLTVSNQQRIPKIWPYWSGDHIAKFGASNPFVGSMEQGVDNLESLLKDAVRHQMVADVPLGAFLSGGVDSSTIVALMQRQSSRPVKTFTIGFNEEGFDEAIHAKEVARYLGTDHNELYVTADQARDVIPLLPSMYDEPFSDSSQIPTFLLSQLARQQVSVSLSGDAGDELFCGYNRYQMTANLWHKLAALPLSLRMVAARGVKSVSPQSWNSLASFLVKLMPRLKGFGDLGNKLHKGAGVLTSQSVDDLYFGLVSNWHDPTSVVIGGYEPLTLLKGDKPKLDGLDEVQRMMAQDMLTYLPDDVLTKLDRAAMSVSLETRLPFLDHRVVEFAWSLPQSMKLKDGQTKWILRQVLYRHLPKELVERPKMGFAIPIDSWLRGPLRDWAEDLLDEKRLQREGYFNPLPIREKWLEHLSKKRNWHYHLWDVLMFQAWLANEKQ